MINEGTLSASVISTGSISGSTDNQSELEGVMSASVVNEGSITGQSGSEGVLTGSITIEKSVTGTVTGNSTVTGNLGLAGATSVVYVEQELTEEQQAQARKNIGIGDKLVYNAGFPECNGVILLSPNGALSLLLAADDDGNLNLYKSES